MGKRYIYILIVAVMGFTSGRGDVCGQDLDSLRKVELTEKLEEYFEALKYENIEVQKAECDFLIESQLADGSWPVPWKWWNEFTAEYEVAAMWWKSHITLKHIVFLKNFGKV